MHAADQNPGGDVRIFGALGIADEVNAETVRPILIIGASRELNIAPPFKAHPIARLGIPEVCAAFIWSAR